MGIFAAHGFPWFVSSFDGRVQVRTRLYNLNSMYLNYGEFSLVIKVLRELGHLQIYMIFNYFLERSGDSGHKFNRMVMMAISLNILWWEMWFGRCEAFSSYPRTYDFIHAIGIESLIRYLSRGGNGRLSDPPFVFWVFFRFLNLSLYIVYIHEPWSKEWYLSSSVIGILQSSFLVPC